MHTAKPGWRLKISYYANVVPKIRVDFGDAGKRIRFDLSSSSRYAMIAIYHSIQEENRNGILKAVEKLIDDEILNRHYGLDNYFNEFAKALLCENCDYFSSLENHLSLLRSNVFLEKFVLKN